MRAKIVLLSAVVALAGLNVGVGSSLQASGAETEPDCQVSQGAASSQSESWLDDAKVQDVVSSVGDTVTEVFGSVTELKEDPLAQVELGYVGTAIDNDAQQLVVVVDP